MNVHDLVPVRPLAGKPPEGRIVGRVGELELIVPHLILDEIRQEVNAR